MERKTCATAPMLQSLPTSPSIALLKVALVHYHLRTGGVTKVIGNQSTALTQLGIEHLVLSAGPEPKGIPHACVPALDYLAETPENSNRLYQTLLAKFTEHHGFAPDLWHIHNPALGKSTLFPQLIQDIAESQTPLILQPHDFAEDNRPSNYPLLSSEQIYPLAPQVHYAFINTRDKGLLEKAGIPSDHSHLLPNAIAVSPSSNSPQNSSTQKTVLYPARGIRRKNLGEVVLLSALAPDDTRFAVSLAPENQQWKDVHDRWQQFATDHQLPIQLDVTDRIAPIEGATNDYPSWVAHSTHLITTSIAEGFGLAYLEPILHQKPLIGRDLPEITNDFREEGISPGRLYHSIPIPLGTLDQESLKGILRKELQASYTQYGMPFQEAHLEAAWKEMTRDGAVDFGNLPEPFQEKIISDAIAGQAKYLLPLKVWLQFVLDQDHPTSTPDKLEHLSLGQSKKDLRELYQAALSAPATAPTWLPKKQVLSQFLSPQRFHLLRSS